MDNFTHEFEIPIGNLPALVERMGALEKKARRLGITDAIGFTEIGRIERVIGRVVDPETQECLGIKRTYVKICVFGPRPKFAGWELIGRLDFEAVPGACLRMMVPGHDCPPEFHDVEPERCDHCGHRRRRNDTFLVQCETTVKVIGRTCLKDFLGHESPEHIAALCELLGQMGAMSNEDGEWGLGGQSRFGGWDPAEVLDLAVYSIRTRGWASSKEDKATKIHVEFLLTPQCSTEMENKRLSELNEVSVKDRIKGAAALTWVRALAKHWQRPLTQQPNSDYMNNLQLVCSHAVVPKTLGIAVSAVTAFTRALEHEITLTNQKKEGVSEHVGDIKERVTFKGEVLLVRTVEGFYGTTSVLKFADIKGNIFTWFASRSPDLHAGGKVVVIGTVKKHDEYQGIKQTVLKRCKVETIEEEG